MNIAIIGGGAAGFFCAIELKREIPHSNITIYESGEQALSKVAITGGGRCNLTNSFREIKSLKSAYPRGEQVIKRAFKVFDQNSTCKWFENESVKLVIQEDQCIFPKSQNALEIVNKLITLAKKLDIKILTNHKVKSIKFKSQLNEESPLLYNIEFNSKENLTTTADFVVVTTGGAYRPESLSFLKEFNLEIVPPAPSLFTFNLTENNKLSELCSCAGNVIQDVKLNISRTKFESNGTILITHWGISGPATLKLSSYSSRYLYDNNYRADLRVKWIEENEIKTFIINNINNFPKKNIKNTHPEKLSSKLWEYLISKTHIKTDLRWEEISSKMVNRIIETITNDCYTINGKGEYKEEFVTAGGISLSNINLNTLEAKSYQGLYFAGEVLDIDAITGGFNLQAAWSTGYVVAKSIKKAISTNRLM